jgi:hypothetical protein
MNSILFLSIGVAVFAVAVLYVLRRVFRDADSPRPFDLGVVSTRWLSELRRDEPWTRT